MNAHWKRPTAALLGMVLAMAAIAQAAEPQMLEGVVVTAGQGVLTMKDGDSKSHTFKAEPATKITFNGKPGKLEEFQPGMPVRVAVGDENRLLSVSTIDDKKK